MENVAFTTCDVCRVLDGDLSRKLCLWCSNCQAWICDNDIDNWFRRARAATIRHSRIAAAITLAIAVLLFAPLAQAQGPPYPYSVALTCKPPGVGTPSGYNFYRAPFATTCGAFTKLTTTPVTTCAYTDQAPPNGLFCYQATDLDQNNNESAPDVMPGQVAIPLPPPTGLGAVVAKNGAQYDVIYSWKNPPGAVWTNTIYCGPAAANRPAVTIFFPTTKVRVTTPAGSNKCGVTATGQTGESGLSNLAQVTVP